VVTKEEQALVQSGPYRRIRHPVYTAYLASYLGGGLLAGNWVLTVVPVLFYAVLVAGRLGREEAVLEATFGERYVAYKARTGRLLPRIRGERS
jgi:protein-S-isoprenylcysteine O-methyltransferase Ste14